MLLHTLTPGAAAQRAALVSSPLYKETAAPRCKAPRSAHVGSHISHAAISRTWEAELAPASPLLHATGLVAKHELPVSPSKSAALPQHEQPSDPRQLERIAVSVLSSPALWHEGVASPSTADDEPGTSSVSLADSTISPYHLARRVGSLAKAGKLDEAVRLVEELSKKNRSDVLQLVSQRYFMMYAGKYKGAAHAYAFLQVLPKRFACAKTFNMALQVCAASRDIQTANAVMNLVDKRQMKPDSKLLTSLINVCRSVGQAERAYNVFLQMKQDKLPLDGQVYGALLAACAEAMQRELTVAHERKDQYVLLEKAFSVVKEADAAHIRLSNVAWNALLSACGRCGQLKRAFEVQEMMQGQGVPFDAISYGSIIEGCVHAKRPDIALRLFERAMAEGHTHHVELYTQAVSACKLEGSVDMDVALGIYATMQRNNVNPDKKFFSALIAVAGMSGRLEQGFEILVDMTAEGLTPGRTICSGLMYACSIYGQPELSRKVYDICATHGVYPDLSQFNRLMDWYAGEQHLGDVVSLLSDMTQRAGHKPNLNTYRILLNACQKTEQGALAFDVFSVMKAQRVPILQEKFAITLYYTLIHVCFNQQRHLWGAKHGAAQPVVRRAEADKMLAALGSSATARSKSSQLLQDATPATWAQYAVSAYRDMVAQGWRPTLDVLDMLMGCLRLPLDKRSPQHKDQQSGNQQASDATAPKPPQAGASQPLQQAGRGDANRYEVTYDRRAVPLLEDAIARGFLPAFTVDQACTVDLRMMPPTLSEVYTQTVMTSLERRAARMRSAAAADSVQMGPAGRTNTASAALFFHKVTLLVPPFNPELVMWPSAVRKLNTHLSRKEAQAQEQAARASVAAPESDTTTQHSSNDGVSEGAEASPVNGEASALHASTSQRQVHHVGLAQHTVSPQTLLNGGAHHVSINQPLHPEVSRIMDASHESMSSSLEDSSTESDSESSGQAFDARGYAASATTGLAVAATCRRLKLFVSINPTKGVVSLEPREVSKWIKAKRTFELRQTGELPSQGAPQGAVAAQAASMVVPEVATQGNGEAAHMVGTFRPGTYGSALMAQQRKIRTGLNDQSQHPQGAFSVLPNAPSAVGKHTGVAKAALGDQALHVSAQ